MTTRFQFADFHGISPVLYAFWTASGLLDEDAMRHQVERCIAAGAHGITVLGLVTEIHKMTFDQRLDLVRLVGQAIGGRVPYSVTIGEGTVERQIAFASASADFGADWVILQPPPTKGISEAALVSFFSDVADGCTVPVAIQNNPVNLDVWLTNDALVELAARNERVRLVKGEGSALAVASLTKRLGSGVGVFAGHGGVELPLNLAGGCVGLIPAPELLDRQVEIYRLFRKADTKSVSEALGLHGEILPWIVMMTRAGIEGMLLYGKALMARRLGLPAPVMLKPAVAPNEFGVTEVEKMHAILGQL